MAPVLLRLIGGFEMDALFLFGLPLLAAVDLIIVFALIFYGIKNTAFTLVPSTSPAEPSRSDDELVARVLAALRSDDVWLDQTLSAFVQIVQREERAGAAGELSRDEATRRIESATLHFQRAILLRNLCVTTDPSPEAKEEATP
jgi:hypothetical protein